MLLSFWLAWQLKHSQLVALCLFLPTLTLSRPEQCSVCTSLSRVTQPILHVFFESHTLSQGNGLSMQGSPEMLPRFKTKVCSALREFTCAGESVSKNKKRWVGRPRKMQSWKFVSPYPNVNRKMTFLDFGPRFCVFFSVSAFQQEEPTPFASSFASGVQEKGEIH